MEPSIKQIHSLSKLNFLTLLFLLLLSISNSMFAQQFDNAYLKWKAEQQAQDAKLKKVDDNYYLAKPSSHSTYSKSSGSTTKKSNTVQKSQLSLGAKISLNSASLEQLQQLNGVGAKKAQAIIDYRNQNGKFSSIDDLQKVKGIGPKLLEKNKALLGL